jgi:putative secretion ATPase (PEP-CTERM system associated)
MYERFYHLRERPFSLSPDPDYLYPSRVHREALSYLRYGIEGHAGFIVITGEIGSGKTTLLQTVLRGLDRQTSVSRLVNTMLDARELVEAVMLDFGLDPGHGRSKPHLLHDLARFLVDQRMAGRLALLVIDEAQNLSLSALEEVRMLSNLETEKSKLIQIVMVGQPNLRQMLSRPELEQLHQRITVSYHLQPLDADDTAAYINHRLRRAALGAPLEFPRDVTDLIHQHSQGIPRKINVIADAVLLFGYGEEQQTIDLGLTRQVLDELESTGVIAAPPDGPAPKLPPAAPPVPRPAPEPATDGFEPPAHRPERFAPALELFAAAAPEPAAPAPAPDAPIEPLRPSLPARERELAEREAQLKERERQLAEQRRVLREGYSLLQSATDSPRVFTDAAGGTRPAWPPARRRSDVVAAPRTSSSAGQGLWARVRRGLFGAKPVFEE